MKGRNESRFRFYRVKPLYIFALAVGLLVSVGFQWLSSWMQGESYSAWDALSFVALLAIGGLALFLISRLHLRRLAVAKRLERLSDVLSAAGLPPFVVVMTGVSTLGAIYYEAPDTRRALLWLLAMSSLNFLVIGGSLFPTVLQRRRRMNAFHRLQPLGIWGALLYGTVFLWLNVSFFTSTSLALSEIGWLTYEGPGGSAVEPVDLIGLHLWHFADSIPLAEVPATLGWSEPAQYEGLGAGAMLLLFKVLVIVPIVLGIKDYTTFRTARERADETSPEMGEAGADPRDEDGR